mmetsp:Transcript_89248/g.158249  ORF Transcript_89248/g.158249 Transcript_89248/m.158249 type:complete len:207 (-) Transcript_89248:1522-2142(-)
MQRGQASKAHLGDGIVRGWLDGHVINSVQHISTKPDEIHGDVSALLQHCKLQRRELLPSPERLSRRSREALGVFWERWRWEEGWHQVRPKSHFFVEIYLDVLIIMQHLQHVQRTNPCAEQQGVQLHASQSWIAKVCYVSYQRFSTGALELSSSFHQHAQSPALAQHAGEVDGLQAIQLGRHAFCCFLQATYQLRARQLLPFKQRPR